MATQRRLLPLGKPVKRKERIDRQVHRIADLDHHERRQRVRGDAERIRRLRQYVRHSSPLFMDENLKSCIDMVLDDVIEYEITPEGKRKVKVDQVLLNGNNVCLLVPGGNPDEEDA